MNSNKCAIAVCLLILVCACAHRQPDTTLTEQLQSFHEFTLGNGIRVVVRQNPMSRVHSIVLTVNGGTAAVAPDKAGLDSVGLHLMSMASKRYPDAVRREILKRSSAAINAGAGLDYSTLQLITIDTYFRETFDLFLDLIMQPALPPDLFREVVTNEINAYRADMTDGYARASRAVNRAFFAGHPYRAHIKTTATLNSLSLQDVKDFYRNTMVASRLTVFASGNFNLEALQKRLDETIGTLPEGSPPPAVPGHYKRGDRDLLLLDSTAQLSPDASYLRGNVAIAPPDHADYYALELAGMMLTDIMNDILRTRNALVYSAWSAVYARQANYANLSAYRTSDPARTIELITAAVNVLAQGKCVSPYSQKELPGPYIDIEEALSFYKKAFSTDYYSGIQDNGAVALKMAAAQNSHGDCRQYLSSTAEAERVSARDIARVAARYLKKGRVTWALCAHPDTIARLRPKCGSALPACESIKLE